MARTGASKRLRLRQIAASPSYRKAFLDPVFLVRDELRPIRLQLELLKPELTLAEARVRSTVVVFGGTRIRDRREALARLRSLEKALDRRPDDAILARAVAIARRGVASSRYYEEARRFGRIVSSACQIGEICDFVIITGGGPGIMEAANRGAADAGAKSIGLNITLPHEQHPNPWITPELCFQFHYFAIRKMHFLLRARALVIFPGGFGTLDELFETLTLIQTRKMAPLPIILIGKEFWSALIDFRRLVDEGLIAEEDLGLFEYAETAEDAWSAIRRFFRRAAAPDRGIGVSPGPFPPAASEVAGGAASGSDARPARRTRVRRRSRK